MGVCMVHTFSFLLIMKNMNSNIVKRIGFSFSFFMLMSGLVWAQEVVPEKKAKKGYRCCVPDFEFNIPKIDTFKVNGTDSLLRNYGLRPVEIPNAYKSPEEGVSTSRMPVVRLSGKNCAAMPGTEQLDKMEDDQKSIPRLKTTHLRIK
ncbi:hypothetical protein M472_06950 [Sphingobacterium paucimobilis HER1398]|uniref:Uncharacterized protein n=2 Tax=Sphingobacterium TaxID=28453 RepID=U2H9S8_9SPHI|nr:hypothetical protein M472_06950 [Sphingobacterium paucimobilis HER1398]